MYAGSREILEDYNVTVRSTKIAVGGNGLITFREGYGVLTSGDLDAVFQDLVAS